MKRTLLIKHVCLFYVARDFSLKVEAGGGKTKGLNADFGRRNCACAAWSHTLSFPDEFADHGKHGI